MVNEAFLYKHTSNYCNATNHNTFLLSNDCVIPTCFCQNCRLRRKDQFAEMSLYRMYNVLMLNRVCGKSDQSVFLRTLWIKLRTARHTMTLAYEGVVSRNGNRGQRSKSNLKCCQIRCLRGSLPLSTIAEFVTTDGMTLSEIYQPDPRFSNVEVSTLSVHYSRQAAKLNLVRKV